MRLLAAAMVLASCASTGSATGRYLLTSHNHDEQVTWGRFGTLEACEEARRGSVSSLGAVCVTADE